MSSAIHRSDSQIQQEVLQELKWDPRVDETEVGVQVEDGVVTLTGTIGSHAKKVAAEQAAHEVHGVLDVANDLVVEIPRSDRISDTEIAHAVRETLGWNGFLGEARIRSTVSDGWVTLEGEVPQLFQRAEATRAVQDLKGVRGVTNRIRVRGPTVEAQRIRSAIERALARQAEREAEHIRIDVDSGVVTLRGTVRSLSERRAVEAAAGLAPGVVHVRDEITVDTLSE